LFSLHFGQTANSLTLLEIWRHVAGPLRSRWLNLTVLIDKSKVDVLADMGFPAHHHYMLIETSTRLTVSIGRPEFSPPWRT